MVGGHPGAFLPGAIAVEGKRPTVAVGATGAAGLAVLVSVFYRFNLQGRTPGLSSASVWDAQFLNGGSGAGVLELTKLAYAHRF
jgi:hypothetical protein